MILCVSQPHFYTPKIMVCPSDDNPVEAHSYVLNAHLCEHGIEPANADFRGLTASDVIVAGRKACF